MLWDYLFERILKLHFLYKSDVYITMFIIELLNTTQSCEWFYLFFSNELLHQTFIFTLYIYVCDRMFFLCLWCMCIGKDSRLNT